jgi:polysaccharide biosynthesis transport protein
MTEDYDEQQPESFDIQRLLGIVQRRHLQFLIPLLFGWLIVWGSSWFLTPRFKSTTLIMVEQPSMPENYVAPNISDDLQARLQSIKTQILSRTRLLTIMDRLHLYRGAQTGATADAMVAQMQSAIDIQVVRDPQKQDISAFSISYSASDPHVAQQVTGEVKDLFISENDSVREQESEGTTSFIEKQLEDARASLSDQEAKVRQFEAQHEGDLPTQEQSNLQILSSLDSQLQNEQDALNTAKQQKVYLQAMMEQERTAEARVRPSGGDRAGSLAPTDLAAIDQQLDKLKAELTEMSSHYTDSYPDVKSLKAQIARTEAVRDNLIAEEKRKARDPKQQRDDDTADPTLSAALRQIQGQLQANQLEIANRESAIAGLKSKIGEYQSRLNSEPGTEQELADLTRGYDQSKSNYDDLLKKKNQSEMATSMEQMQQGERFSMLDPPSLPSKPDFPNRLKFCMMGAAVGMFLGLAIAVGSEFMDGRLYTEKEIKAILPVAVISEVPEVISSSDEQNAKRKLRLGWATTGLVIVTILAGSIFSYLHS